MPRAARDGAASALDREHGLPPRGVEPGVRGLDVNRVELYLGELQVAKAGGRAPAYREEDGKRAMAKSEITVRVVLNRGRAATTVWTCDLSHEYVTINAEYRT